MKLIKGWQINYWKLHTESLDSCFPDWFLHKEHFFIRFHEGRYSSFWFLSHFWSPLKCIIIVFVEVQLLFFVLRQMVPSSWWVSAAWTAAHLNVCLAKVIGWMTQWDEHLFCIICIIRYYIIKQCNNDHNPWCCHTTSSTARYVVPESRCVVGI